MDVRYVWFRYYAFIIINNNNNKNKYIFLEFSSYLITNSVFQIKVKTQGKHTGWKRTTFDGINGEATGYETSSENFYFFPLLKLTSFHFTDRCTFIWHRRQNECDYNG